MKRVKTLVFMGLAIFSFSVLNAQTTPKKAPHAPNTAAKQYQCPMKCEGEKTYSKAGRCPTCGMQLKEVSSQATTKAYQCPMKCEGDKTYTTQGKCPKCGMQMKSVAQKNPPVKQ